MIEPSNKDLSIVAQCQLLSISRSGLYYTPKGESPLNLQIMELIDKQYLLEVVKLNSARTAFRIGKAR